MKIGKRLNRLCTLVGNRGVVIDVGTDHGKLAKKVLDEGQVDFVYATDISKKCLEKAENVLKNEISEQKAKCIVSDGLLGLDEIKKCDLVIIAGMGGNEIVKILSENKRWEEFFEFLLQPMQDAEILRGFLAEAGFKILSDEILEERGKFYSILKVRKITQNERTENLDELSKYFGKFYKTDESSDFKGFLEYTRKTLRGRAQYLTKNDLLKLNFCENILDE